MDKVQTSLHPTDESNDVNMQNLRMALVPQYVIHFAESSFQRFFTVFSSYSGLL